MRIEERIALGVQAPGLPMTFAIDLDDQSTLVATEVDDIRADWLLAANAADG